MTFDPTATEARRQAALHRARTRGDAMSDDDKKADRPDPFREALERGTSRLRFEQDENGRMVLVDESYDEEFGDAE